MTGLTAALFCILVVSALGQFCLKIDMTWYAALNKPAFMLSPFGFTAVVSVVYAFSAAVITKLVVGRRFFPSMAILALSGGLSVLYIFVVFRLKSLYGGAVVALALFLISFALLVRFTVKDRTLALLYLPVCAFNAYALTVSFALALA